jgi:hypothetical protein
MELFNAPIGMNSQAYFAPQRRQPYTRNFFGSGFRQKLLYDDQDLDQLRIEIQGASVRGKPLDDEAERSSLLAEINQMEEGAMKSLVKIRAIVDQGEYNVARIKAQINAVRNSDRFESTRKLKAQLLTRLARGGQESLISF